MKWIAVEGCTLSMSPLTSGQVQITTPPSERVLADGKKCYSGDIGISISGYSGGAIDVPSSGSGTGTLSGSAEQGIIDGKGAVLEGDQTTITVYGQKQSGSSTVPATQDVTVTVQSAGQNKVRTI